MFTVSLFLQKPFNLVCVNVHIEPRISPKFVVQPGKRQQREQVKRMRLYVSNISTTKPQRETVHFQQILCWDNRGTSSGLRIHMPAYSPYM